MDVRRPVLRTGVGRAPVIRGKYFRLVIPNLQWYSPGTPQLKTLKEETLVLILEKETPVGLEFYKVAIETHPSTGVPHLDILLTYKKSRPMSLNRFDYLIKHGHLTRYRKLNQAILEYGDKQDPFALTNFPETTKVLLRSALSQEFYETVLSKMVTNPFNFDAHEWLRENNLDTIASGKKWPGHLNLIKRQQEAQCNLILKKSSLLKIITPEKIKEAFTAQEYELYLSNMRVNDIYSKIISKLNQISKYGTERLHKLPHLFLVGRPDIGKTALALKIKETIPIYPVGVHNWFPRYKPGIYKMIFWNQFNLKTMPYPELLNFLEGVPMDLQYKGGSVLRSDNQLIYMTSNMTLQQHICSKFKTEELRQLARKNLKSRIDQIIIPVGIDLFPLLKLIQKDL